MKDDTVDGFPTIMRNFASPLPIREKETDFKEEEPVPASARLSSSPERRRRSKLTVEARESAREVRQKGACLRCRMLKVKVRLTSFLEKSLLFSCF